MSEYLYVPHTSGGMLDLTGYPSSLTAEELTEANDQFQHYVFFQRDKRDKNILWLWTSCCQHEKEQYERLRELMDGEHLSFAAAQHNDDVRCPYCGREAKLKDMGKIGKAASLEEYIPVVFLKAGPAGELYATGFWMWKGYDYFKRQKRDFDHDSFSLQPLFKLTYCYKFEPGRATMHERTWQDGIKYETTVESLERPRGKRKVREPFTQGTGMYLQYCNYRVIGYDAIEKSAFKYCQYRRFRSGMSERYILSHSCLMRYLTAASLYPKAVEMLVKNGMQDLVGQLVFSRKKNVDLIDWEEPNPRKAFGLTKQELQEWMSRHSNVELLRTYKTLRKYQMPVTFEEATAINREFYGSHQEFVKSCCKYRIKPMRFIKYLEQFAGYRCHGGGITTEGVFRHWQDYVDAAIALSYDLGNETVLLPKRLEDVHDEAVAEVNRRNAEAARRQKEKERKEAEEQFKALTERLIKNYTFALDGYVLRAAMSSEEIITEGCALQHCVSGYATRHMEGKLVICFLRLANEPDKPMVTIELDTNGKMVQARGFKNDRDAVPAAQTYKDILDKWLAWIAKGSKRDEDGNPVTNQSKTPRRKTEVHAA